MQQFPSFRVRTGLAMAFALMLGACAPEVGSDAWCEKMLETPTGDWSTNNATDFAQHCVFKKYDK